MTDPKQPRSNSRASEKVPTKVFVFGCKRPTPEDEQWLRDQAFKANDVQAAMIRNEMSTRERRDAIVAVYVPEYRAAKDEAARISAEIDALYEKLSDERRRVRKRIRVADVESEIVVRKKERTAAWKHASDAKRPFLAELKPYWDDLKAIKVKLLEGNDSPGSRAKGDAQREALRQLVASGDAPEVWVLLARLSEDDNAAHCAIRRKGWRPETDPETPEHVQKRRAAAWEHPLDNDTKEMAREAFLQSKSKTGAEGGRMREPRGSEGRVGLMWDKASAPAVNIDGTINDRRFTLIPQEPEKTDNRDPNSRRSQLRRRMLATFQIAGRLVAVKVLAHREFPRSARIKRAWISIKPRGRYELQLVVQSEAFAQRPNVRRHDAVAVKPTWKIAEPGAKPTDSALIAGEWVGSDGESGTICLDARTNQAFEIVETLRKNQDDYHNEARDALLAWLESEPDDVFGVGWLKDATKDAMRWRSTSRLARLVLRMRHIIPELESLWADWKAECFTSGADLFMPVDAVRAWLESRGIDNDQIVVTVYLEWWRRKDQHLRKYEANMRETALRRRREGYRVAAARLAGRYEELRLCAVDLKRAARKKRPEQDIEGPEEAWTGQRRRAAPSELTQALANAFGTKENRARVKAKTPAEAIGQSRERSGRMKTPATARNSIGGAGAANNSERIGA